MVLFQILLLLLFVGAAAAALIWIRRRLRAGWRREFYGATAAIVVLPLAWVGWRGTLSQLTNANYVCILCGRTEEQWRFVGATCSRTVRDAGEEFPQRFPSVIERGHVHDWHVESCLYDASGRVSCTMQCIGGWFRALPKLADRAAADELVREAQRLPRAERAELMDSVTASVWCVEDDFGGLDAAFVRWQARRKN